MAIWSMGSQTQILIGYLPVPAPLLCKYWTSTFFTVTCIWKKRKRVREEWGVGGRGGRLRTDTVEWMCCRGQTLPPPSMSLSDPPSLLTPETLQPTTNKCISASLSLTLGTGVKAACTEANTMYSNEKQWRKLRSCFLLFSPSLEHFKCCWWDCAPHKNLNTPLSRRHF